MLFWSSEFNFWLFKFFSLHIKLENVRWNPSRFFKFSIGNLISTNFTNSRAIASWISIVINFSLIKILRKCIGLDFHDVLQSCLNVSPPIESPIDQSRFTPNICFSRNADLIFEMFRMLVVNSFYEHIFRKHVFYYLVLHKMNNFYLWNQAYDSLMSIFEKSIWFLLKSHLKSQ